eukprot:365249-Chlamydomonas_euryale.AAC.21
MRLPARHTRVYPHPQTLKAAPPCSASTQCAYNAKRILRIVIFLLFLKLRLENGSNVAMQ